jgi:hypothetical protein
MVDADVAMPMAPGAAAAQPVPVAPVALNLGHIPIDQVLKGGLATGLATAGSTWLYSKPSQV